MMYHATRSEGQAGLSPEAICSGLFFGGLVDLGMKGYEDFIHGLTIADRESCRSVMERLEQLVSLEIVPERIRRESLEANQ